MKNKKLLITLTAITAIVISSLVACKSNFKSKQDSEAVRIDSGNLDADALVDNYGDSDFQEDDYTHLNDLLKFSYNLTFFKKEANESDIPTYLTHILPEYAFTAKITTDTKEEYVIIKLPSNGLYQNSKTIVDGKREIKITLHCIGELTDIGNGNRYPSCLDTVVIVKVYVNDAFYNISHPIVMNAYLFSYGDRAVLPTKDNELLFDMTSSNNYSLTDNQIIERLLNNIPDMI